MQKALEESTLSPKTMKKALNSKYSQNWEKAVASEMKSLKDNGVYKVVDRPKRKKIVKSKWVLRMKTDSQGRVEKYNARVVAKGYNQVKGVDYEQTFC